MSNQKTRPERAASIRFAVIGAGGMGAVHAASIATFADAAVTWVADVDDARSSRLATQVGARATTSMEEAVGAGDVDAVVIALPTSLHRLATELAAAHGKHVFCEKPVARTPDDAQAMIDACTRAGVRLMIGHVVRFFDEYATIKRLLDAGTIGQPGMVRASRLNAPVMARSAWFADLERNGGIVCDLMIHELDTLRWYFGAVERVFAHGLTYTPYQPTRDYAMASLRFRNGATALVETSWAHTGFRTAIELSGQYGIIRHASDTAATLTVERTAAEGGIPAVVRQRPLGESPYQRELRHFIDRVRTDTPFLTSGDEGKAAVALACAILESMRTGRPTHPEPVVTPVHR
ncbi:MAG: Gfo/Idh/MocA family oxidoreductase [Chloroflexia bacterium]|nr:Gfo/Idh/MocA family oxidoreductase [Chloroflexia bacterium]